MLLFLVLTFHYEHVEVTSQNRNSEKSELSKNFLCKLQFMQLKASQFPLGQEYSINPTGTAISR